MFNSAPDLVQTCPTDPKFLRFYMLMYIHWLKSWDRKSKLKIIEPITVPIVHCRCTTDELIKGHWYPGYQQGIRYKVVNIISGSTWNWSQHTFAYSCPFHETKMVFPCFVKYDNVSRNGNFFMEWSLETCNICLDTVVHVV